MARKFLSTTRNSSGSYSVPGAAESGKPFSEASAMKVNFPAASGVSSARVLALLRSRRRLPVSDRRMPLAPSQTYNLARQRFSHSTENATAWLTFRLPGSTELLSSNWKSGFRDCFRNGIRTSMRKGIVRFLRAARVSSGICSSSSSTSVRARTSRVPSSFLGGIRKMAFPSAPLRMEIREFGLKKRTGKF